MRLPAVPFTVFAIVALSAFPSANANLLQKTVGDSHVVWDSFSNLTWFWDVPLFADKTYDEQVALLNGLNEGSGYFGLSGWHLASLDEIHTFIDTFPFGYRNTGWDVASSFPLTLTSYPYGVGGRIDDGPNWGPYHTTALFYLNCPWGEAFPGCAVLQGVKDDLTSPLYGAWAVTIDPTTVPMEYVPEPASLLLVSLGLGVIGLAAWRRRR